MPHWGKFQVERVSLAEPAVIVLRFRGALMGTQECYDFLEEIQNEARERPLRLVIDLSGLAHLDSTGVGLLAAIYTSVTNRGGHLCVTGVQGRVALLLKVVHLFDVLQREETEEAAIRRVSA
jgi:anti-anti-sigma factor